MVSIVLFFIVISSGSVLASAMWNKRYEEVLPITCSAIILLLFLCGVAGSLLSGAILVCLLAVLVYAFAGFNVIKRASWIDFLRNLFTPAFFVFACVSAVILYVTFGKVAATWDEFTHWMDIVKVMSMLDTFGTNPLSGSAFASYPPGMGLFQYFLQKLYQWTSSGTMSEWRAYFAYYILDAAFLLPFLRELSSRKVIPIITAALIILLGPLPFNGDYYWIIYIEAYLSVLFGTGLAMVFFRKKNDSMSMLYIWCVCAMLVLAKDAGLLLAIIVIGVYLFDLWCIPAGTGVQQKKALTSGLMLCSVLLPYALWNYKIEIDHVVRRFNEPYDIALLLRILLGQDDSYRSTVWTYYLHEILFRPVRLSFSYGALLVFLMLLVCILAYSFVRWNKMPKREAALMITAVIFQFFVFIVGLGATYIMRFSASGAMQLVSFERYLSIPYCGCWMFIVALVMSQLGSKDVFKFVSYGFTAALICVTSVMDYGIATYITKEHVRESVSVRDSYTVLAEKIEEIVPDNASVCVISQEDSGLDYWILRYVVRPKHIVRTEFSWSIGKPFYEGDIWTTSLTADEWQRMLAEDCDYVALYHLNDYFYKTFAAVFEDPADIEEQAVYIVDHETGILTKCAA